jgi:hypothetical protein
VFLDTWQNQRYKGAGKSPKQNGAFLFVCGEIDTRNFLQSIIMLPESFRYYLVIMQYQKDGQQQSQQEKEMWTEFRRGSTNSGISFLGSP